MSSSHAIRRTGIIMCGMATAALLAGVSYAASRSELAKSAERLERETRAAAAHADTVSPVYRDDVHELAQRVAEFRSAVETDTVSDSEVSADFKRVAVSYEQFRAEVDHARTQQSYADLRAVTAPYEDIERELGIHAGYGTRE